MRRPYLLTVAVVFALSIALSGCGALGGKSPSGPGPGEVALLYLSALKGDAAGLKAYNPGTSWDETVLDSTNDATLASLGITLDDQQREELTKATKTGLAKVEAKVVSEQVEDGIATVVLSIRGIDLASSFTQQFEAVEKAAITPKTKPEIYGQALARAWTQAPLIAEPVEVKMVLTHPPGGGSAAKWTPKASDGAKEIIKALVKTA